MKKLLILLLALATTNVIAATATFAGNVYSAAGANWYFEGYKLDNGQMDCHTKATFSNTPQDGYKQVKQSQTVMKSAQKVEGVCTPSGDGDNGKLCIIKADYVPSKTIKGEFDITKITTAQEKTGKLTCQ